jgi:hypothetical protein
MDVVRRTSLLVSGGLLAVVALIGSIRGRQAMKDGTATQLAASTRYFDSTIVLARSARPQGVRGDALAVALTYLERLRLGLASPFLLVDEALADPRLDYATHSRVAWALLGRLQRGDAYVIDPAVFDGVGPWTRDGQGATGAAHVDLIDHAIRSATDPRAGELAVRLAYMIAAGEGSVSPSSVSIATQVAALVRDRVLAEQDLQALLADARQQRADVMAMLIGRRVSREFEVEQPALARLDAELRTEAMDEVPALVRALDTLERAREPKATARANASVLGEAFARRAQTLAAFRPPLAQVIVTLRSHPESGFFATNDESLAAAYAPLSFSVDSSRRLPALAVLSSAVALRTRAQTTPWFVGDATPTTADLAAEFGLADVSFASSVPAQWRPYFLRELADGLRDMEQVFPALSVSGLRVKFRVETLRDSALALHDPRTRTLELSIATSGGTLAHELSHDLDWQTARRLFADGRGYSTDRAMADQRGPLASSVSQLAAEARLVRWYTGGPSPVRNDRPAEVFARSADWFVASTLALHGRSNGYLTAVQDPMLPGYAAGPPVAVGAAGTGSLLSAIEQMTYVPDTLRASFEAAWSDANVVDPVIMVRRVLETTVSWRGLWQRVGAGAVSLPPVTGPACLPATTSEARARERLLMLAVDARARGAAVRRARYYPSSLRAEWATALLHTPPWRSDLEETLLDGLRSSVLTELMSEPTAQGVVPVVPLVFRSAGASCASSSR